MVCRVEIETIAWSSSNSEIHTTPHRQEDCIGQLKFYCITGGNFPQTLKSGKECDSVRRQYLVKLVSPSTDTAIASLHVHCSTVSRPDIE